VTLDSTEEDQWAVEKYVAMHFASMQRLACLAISASVALLLSRQYDYQLAGRTLVTGQYISRWNTVLCVDHCAFSLTRRDKIDVQCLNETLQLLRSTDRSVADRQTDRQTCRMHSQWPAVRQLGCGWLADRLQLNDQQSAAFIDSDGVNHRKSPGVIG